MIVGEITVDEILEQFQKALDTNDLDKAIMCARDLGQFTSDSWSVAYGTFRAKNNEKISAVGRACSDVHERGEVGNNDLFLELILERWENIDNDCK